MKNNQNPQDIEEMDFEVITLAGKGSRPINPGATFIACKGEKETPMKGNIFVRALRAFKGYFPQNFSYPVSVDVLDDIDNDGDGADDYNALFGAISAVGYDLQNACGMADEDARSEAIKTAIDKFLAELDAFRSGVAQKAGARHSKADQEHIDAMKEMHAKMGEHLSALSPDDEAEKAAKTEGKYGDVAYADEKNKKYPIDTEEHARAAWSYINKKKNAAEYSADELATVKSRIKAACKKFGIEISDEANKGDEPMTDAEKAALVAEIQAGLDAKVDAAVKAATESATAPLNEKIDAQASALEAANKAAEDAKAAAEKAVADAEAAKAAADKQIADAQAAQKAAEAALADAVTKARGRKAAGGHEEGGAQEPSAVLAERLKENPSLKIAQAVEVLMSGAPVTVPPQ